jgi:hypothetical protein
LPWELPLGINLYSEQYSIGVQASILSPERQEAVTGHKLRSKDDAVDFADDIEQREGAQPVTPPTPAPVAPAKRKKQAAAAKRKAAARNEAAGSTQP